MPETDSALVGAVDLGGTKILSLVLDRAGNVRGRDLRPTEAAAGPDVVLGRVRDSLREALRAAGTGARLRAAGIAAPGPIDFERGVVVEAPNLPGWQNVEAAARLGSMLDCPTVLENDANAAAWGEFTAGAGRGARHMIYLTISTGIGGGLVLDGKLYRGANGAAGELGHIPLVADGPPCGCGSHGCLEQLASGPAITRRALDMIAAGAAPLLADLAGESEFTAELVHEAAERGDTGALAVIAEAGRHLGSGLVMMVNAFNPDVIVIGGGTAKIGGSLLDPALAELRTRAMRLPREHVRVLPAALGPTPFPEREGGARFGLSTDYRKVCPFASAGPCRLGSRRRTRHQPIGVLTCGDVY
jgi:glucokinase